MNHAWRKWVQFAAIAGLLTGGASAASAPPVAAVAAASPEVTSPPPDCLSTSGSPTSAICGQGRGFCHDVTSVWQTTGADGEPLPSRTTIANGSLDDIYACGPMPGNGDPGYGDEPFEASPNGFQCTELANRFLWDLWRDPPVNNSSPGAGNDLTGAKFASVVAETYKVPLVPDGTAKSPYLPGDIVSFKGDAGFGHVAVVIASTYTSADAGTGNYVVTIEQENATGTISQKTPTGTGTANITVKNWYMQLPSIQAAIDFAVIPSGLGPEPWSITHSSNPGVSNVLNSVSCVSGSNCWAVGDKTNSAEVATSLIEHWNGSKWSVWQSPNPAGAAEAFLQGISCTAVSSCEAVGYSYSSPDNETYTLAEVWNGSHWTIQPTPSPGPAGAVQDDLRSVSCTKMPFCIATGYSTLAGGDEDIALAETFNGTGWTARTIPPHSPKYALLGGLASVSCVSNTLCAAVGSTMMAIWNGSTWGVTSKPSDPAASSMNSVSCVTATFCVGIGTYDTGFAWQVYTETWNGSIWSGKAINDDDYLAAISCSEPDSCTAVGTVGPGPAASAIWDGVTWKATNTASVPGQPNQLYGVSCVGPYSCAAVGELLPSSGYETLTEAN